MKSACSPQFWVLYNRLPGPIQETALRNFQLWLENPRHPSLHFKVIRGDLWSVRIGQDYRALAEVEDGAATWFWIGTHAAYDLLIG